MLAILSLAVLQITADPAAEVRLRPTAICSTSVVRLADVADVVASDSHFAQALAELPLCPAPGAGSDRSLNQQAVRELLAISGVERKDYRITGSESVTVSFSPSTSTAPGKYPLVASGVRHALFVPESPSKLQVVKPTNPASISASAQKPANAPALVERGSIVSVIAKAAGVRITATGKALDAGSEGEAVNVELTDTKQRVLAYVTGPQSVEMKTPGLQ